VPTLHMTASGKICQDASTGRLKKHDAALCCVDCTHCSGSTDNAPIAYKAAFDRIIANDPEDCENCNAYNISYVVPYLSSCTWRNTADVPDECSVPNAATNSKVEITVNASDVSVLYVWGLSGIQLDILFVESVSSPDCLTFNARNIPYSANVVGAYCNASATEPATCELTSLG
jgi:hypothetical protein